MWLAHHMPNIDADQDVLDAAFFAYKAAQYPLETDGDAFEYFSAEQFMKEYAPTNSEIRKGVIGRSKDGGIDSLYVVLNENEILDVDSPVVVGQATAISALSTAPILDVIVIQSKWSPSWQSDPITRARDSLEQLLDRSVDEVSFESIYASQLLERTRIFRLAYTNLLSKSPIVRVTVRYVTKGPARNLADAHDQENKQTVLKQAIQRMLPTGSSVEAELVGATGMCAVLRSTPAVMAAIEFANGFVKAADSFVGLVTISDYLTFMHRPGTRELRPGLFESNVRDFAGEAAKVNQLIKETITSDDSTSFWWLNNGVTVLVDDATDVPPRGVNLTRPLVVNGLQTTRVIHAASIAGTIPPSRLAQSILVRIIKSSDAAIRDAVIAGTNRQTSITSVQLKATELLHVQIEEYLSTIGWFYERRRHQYRGARKPASRVVTINELAQAMIAVSLGRPADARARPSSLTSDAAIYEEIFAANSDRVQYGVALQIMDVVDQYIQSPEGRGILDDPTNARYYVATGYTLKKLRAKNTSSIKFANNHLRIDPKLTDKQLTQTMNALKRGSETISKANAKLTRDQIFKGAELMPEFLKELYPPKP
jgi:hypothetical protein